MIAPTHISKAKLAGFQKLLQKKYRQLGKQFLVEGTHLVQEALASEWSIDALLVTQGYMSKEEYSAIARQASKKNILVNEVTDRELEKLSDAVTSQGIVGIVRQKDVDVESVLKRSGKQSLVVALDGVADPGNVGTIIRTCDWFGVTGILLSTDTVELYNPKVVRATMGSIFHLPIIADADLSNMLPRMKKEGMTILAASLEGKSMFDVRPLPERAVLLFGNEARGVSAELQRYVSENVTIPRFGKAESLNVASACAAILTAIRFEQS